MPNTKDNILEKRGGLFSGRYGRQHLLFAVLILAGIAFAVWKTFYGGPSLDETFYLTVPHRYAMGDVPFKNEWHLSAMTGFLQLPFVWVYTTLFGTEGMILAARMFYVFVHAAVTVVIYSRVYKSGLLSIAACFTLFIFAPYNIMQLCYNSMGIDLIVLSGILLATADYKRARASLIISGVCLAGAVLCCPYFASAYVLYVFCVIVHALMKKFGQENGRIISSEMFSVRSFLYLTVGVLALSFVFFAFLFSRMSFSELFESIPYMLSDPEHQNMSVWDKLMSYNNNYANTDAFLKAAPYGLPAMQIPFILYLACFAAVLVERSLRNGKRKTVGLLFVILTAVTAVYSAVIVVLLLFNPNVYGDLGGNMILFPLVPIALGVYALSDNRPKGIFAAIFIPALNICENFNYIAFAYYIMLFVLILDKKRMKHRGIYLIITALVSTLALILIIPDLGNRVMFPLIFIGITSYILCEKQNRELYAAVFLPGILYTFCIHMGSNQGFNVISMAFTIVNTASVLFLAQVLGEIKESSGKQKYSVSVKRVAALCAAVTVALQIGLEIESKATEVFLDAVPSQCTARIPRGPAKGIMASEGHAAYQMSILEYTDIYNSEEPGNILFLSIRTMPYLAVGNGKFPYGTYSAWLSGENETSFERLKSYFALHPEKTPKYIHMQKDSGFDTDSVLRQLMDMGYNIVVTNTDYRMTKIE